MFRLVLSLDGLGVEHDLNRCNSLKNIDLDFFRGLKKPIVNSVFTPEAIDRMCQITTELHQQGFFVKGFIADGEQWKTEHIAIVAQQLMELVSFYLEHPTVSPMSLLNQPLFYLTSPKFVRRCGTERHEEVSVSADGQQWACHRCSPFENHGTWTIPERYIGLLNARHLLVECQQCFLERICNACPASNAAMKDNPELSHVQCSIRKLLFKANAYFALLMLATDTDYAGLRPLTNEKKLHLAESAKMIMDNL